MQTGAAILMVFVFCIGGCKHTTNSGTIVSASPNPPAAPAVAHSEYNREIAKLNQIVKKNKKSSATKEAHLKLARLHSNHKNNNRNYQKALEHLQAYIRLDNARVGADTLNWLSSLREIERLSREVNSQNRQISQMKQKLEQSKKEKLALSRTNRKLRREEISLRDKTRKLKESNLKLQKTIEMLKDLDQRLEEKRRNFNSKRQLYR
jgi:DNA repair exonuclease SbcCD ATPase subunit